jgi:hypothetical protein
VLLAGDAAHTHIPSGGQGLQIGIQDAFNLGWKLAATVDGWAPDGLLDSYERERYPVATETLRRTDISFRYETSRALWAAVARRIAIASMRFGAVQKSIVDNFAGFRLRYVGPAGASRHWLVGRRLPDVHVADASGRATRIHEALRTRRFILLDQTRDGVFACTAAAERPDRVSVIRGHVTNRSDIPAALFVRPDGIVAWATSQEDDALLGHALRYWCGAALARAGEDASPAVVNEA